MQFNTNNIDVKDTKRLTLTDFRGVDTANPIYNVATNRASAMKNFTSINGNNHKRGGWKQYLRFNGAINGVFDFLISGNRVRMVYAGTTFWIYNESSSKYVTAESYLLDTQTNISTYKLSNNLLKEQPTKLFLQNEKAFFVGCGDFIVLYYNNEGKLVFERVYNGDKTEIPLTTTNIECLENEYYTDGEYVQKVSRKEIETPNAMHNYRINAIIGSQNNDTTTGGTTTYADRTYQLDNGGKNILNKDGEITIKISTATLNNGVPTGGTTIENLVNYGFDGSESIVTLMPKKIDLEASTIEYLNFESRLPYVYYPKLLYTTGSTHEIYFSVVKDATSSKRWIQTPSGYRQVDDRSKVMIKVNNETKFIGYVSYKGNLDISGKETFTGSQYITIDSNNTKLLKIEMGSLFEAVHTSISNRKTTSYDTGLEFYATGKVANLYADTDTTHQTIKGKLNCETGILTLKGYHASINGEANIEVKYGVDMFSYADKISNCRISTLFGTNGNSDTLFVSGNNLYPHFDWWSKATDFSYFPTGNECALGSQSSAIVGYQRLGDDSLAIYKEQNYNEPTLYIRSGTSVSVSEDGDIVEASYITAGKYIVQGAVSEEAFGMLCGDSMFLANDGVYALSLSADTISISQRVARERGRFISKLLKTHSDLSKAKAFVHNNKYYLAIDGDVYVADSRFTFTAKGDIADTYNYEWWVWDNCPVNYWFEDEDDNLCFGTTDGRLCRFEQDVFIDRKYETFFSATFTERAKVGGYIVDGYLTVSNQNEFEEEISIGDIYPNNLVVLKGDVKRCLLRNTADFSEALIGGNNILVTESKYNELIGFTTIRLANVTSSTLSANTDYILAFNPTYIDASQTYYAFRLLNPTTGAIVSIGNDDKFNIIVSADGETYKVSSFRVGTENRYYLYEKDATITPTTKKVDIIGFTTTSANGIKVLKYIPQNVKAVWFTPALDMNANDYIKTLMGLTVATEQITNGQLSFGYETKGARTLVDMDSKGLDIFDFNNLNFGRYTFDTGFTTSFSRKVKDDFNFIIFKFESDNEYDCCVYSLIASYKINRKNKGVF